MKLILFVRVSRSSTQSFISGAVTTSSTKSSMSLPTILPASFLVLESKLNSEDQLGFLLLFLLQVVTFSDHQLSITMQVKRTFAAVSTISGISSRQRQISCVFCLANCCYSVSNSARKESCTVEACLLVLE